MEYNIQDEVNKIINKNIIKISETPDSIEIYTYIFTILEHLKIPKWSKMYNKGLFIEAFSQSNVEPYEYMNKSSDTVRQAIKRVFNTSKYFKNKKQSEVWRVYFLKLINMKRCTQCKEIKNYTYFSDNTNKFNGKQDKCKQCSKEYRELNKDLLANKRVITRIDTYIYLVDKKLVKPYCENCGYNKNWAAIETHHINVNIQKPEYAINSSPAKYIFGNTKYLAEERYIFEKENLMQLCRNCHQKEHFISDIDNQIGLKQALNTLGYKYICRKCSEDKYLHLHHNNPIEKDVSFYDFSGLSKERILSDGLLQIEMKKDVSILCGNHHAEIHNPNWENEKIFEEL